MQQDPLSSLRRQSGQPTLQAVIGALTEVLEDQQPLDPMGGRWHAPTSYFAVTLYTLQNSPEADPLTLAALMQTLSALFYKLDKAVIQTKFETLAKLFTYHLREHTDNKPMVRSICVCINVMLLGVDVKKFAATNADVMGLFQAMLVFSVDSRPKIRKTSQRGVFNLFGYVSETYGKLPKVLVERLTAWSQRELKQCTPKDYQTALHLCGLLQNVLPLLPLRSVGQILSPLLELAHLGNSKLVHQVLSSVGAIFAAETLFASDSVEKRQKASELITRLVTLVGSFKPNPLDQLASVVFYKTLSDGIVCLLKLNPASALDFMRDFPQFLLVGMSSSKPNVIASCCAAVQVVGLAAFEYEEQQEAKGSGVANRGSTNDTVLNHGLQPVEVVVDILHVWLTFQYKHVWKFVFDLIASLFKQIKGMKVDMSILGPIMRTLGDRHRSTDGNSKPALENCIGCAVRTFGATSVVSMIPLNLPQGIQQQPQDSTALDNMKDLIEKKSKIWLLPILKTYCEAGNGSLKLFSEQFLPSAIELRTLAVTAAALRDKPFSNYLLAIVGNIWSVYQAFCNLPQDEQGTIKKLNRQLGQILLDGTDSVAVLAICAGLTTLIRSNQSQIAGVHDVFAINVNNVDDVEDRILSEEQAKSNLAELTKNAKQFLPMFFNVLSVVVKDKREGIFQAINAYGSVAPGETCNQLFTTVLNEISAEEKTQERMDMSMLMGIVVALSNELSETNLQYLLNQIGGLLVQQDNSVQKQAYKVLQKVFTKQPEVLMKHWVEINTTLVEASPLLMAPAHPARLRCLGAVLSVIPEVFTTNPQVLQALQVYLGEVILALRSHKNKTQSTAGHVLTELGHKMKDAAHTEWDMNVQTNALVPDYPLFSEYLSMLLAGLAGNTQKMQGAAVFAITRMVFEFSDLMPQHTISQLITLLMPLFKKRSREVIQAVLAFTQVTSLAVEPFLLEDHLPAIIEGITIWARDRKNRFRHKVRKICSILVARCGADAVLRVIPKSHEPLILYLRKQLGRKERKNLERKHARKTGQSMDQEEDFQDHNYSEKPTDFDSILYGSDNEEDDTFESSHADGSRTAERWLQDGNIDLLDGGVSTRMTTVDPSKSHTTIKKQTVKYGEDGRLLLGEAALMEEESDGSDGIDDDNESFFHQRTVAKASQSERKKKEAVQRSGTKRRVTGGPDQTDFNPANTSQAKRARAMRRGDVSGDAYKSKKAGGDMTKGPMAPYAFYSLNPAVLNRRKRHKKDDRFTGLIQHKGERVQGNKMTKSQRLARAKARANTRTKNKSWEDR